MTEFIDKKKLSEQDISTKFIVPAIQRSGWDVMLQVSEQKFITDGRIILSGKSIKRGEKKKPDFVLSYHKNFPLAVIEVKDNNHSIASGIQQALGYAEILDAPFSYSTNGDGFLEHDFLTGQQRDLSIDQLPSPEELYNRYKQRKNIGDEVEKIIQTPYYQGNLKKTPRYYQQVAINRAVKAVADEQKRILLVMATGTGKTFTAAQIIWRLWKSGAKKRILFLADRNILVDQTMTNDFKHFGGKMTKIQNRKVDPAYEVYLGLYQALTGNEEEKNIYKQFSPSFFDLIVIDECHRGSAREDSNWREILEYFSAATQIGLTATPKETKDISNIEYFGEPIYTYSLKQGIDDGFLAPYKVIRVMLDKDIGGYRPSIQDRDREGNQIEDKVYDSKNFDRDIVLTERTKAVAKEITRFLKKTDRFSKTIVFCVDIEHAERMTKALIDENSDLVKQNRKYIMQITGDNNEGKMELDNFIDVEKTYPAIVTTSKLLTTGVDAQTCKLIVLDANISSSTEFKQIIGRGTRIREDLGKTHFTILDFRRATDLFSDSNFDGDPIQIKEIKQGEELSDEDVLTEKNEDQNIEPNSAEDSDFIVNHLNSEPFEEKAKTEKIYVDNVEVSVVYKQKQFLDENGKLITGSFKDFSKKKILQNYASLDDFISKWSVEGKKFQIIQELENQGISFVELQSDVGEIGKNLDPFDLILHVAFGRNKIVTRQERVNNIRKKNYLAKYNGQAKKVLDALLDKYAKQGVAHIEDINILAVNPFSSIGSPIEIIQEFGGRDAYFLALRDLESEIYSQINY